MKMFCWPHKVLKTKQIREHVDQLHLGAHKQKKELSVEGHFMRATLALGILYLKLTEKIN